MENLFATIPNIALPAALFVLLLLAAILFLLDFLRRPRPEQLALVQEWLLWAVTRAESALGSGTGEKKLAMVYSWFEVRFPVMCKLVTFDQFADMVDDALEQLEKFLIDDAIMDMMIGEAGKDESV